MPDPIPFLVALALGVGVAFIAVAIDNHQRAYEREHPCLKTEKKSVTTYPFMGMMAMGSSYTGIALMPVTSSEHVCVLRQE